MTYTTDEDRHKAIVERLDAIERALNPPPKPDLNQILRDTLADNEARQLQPIADSIARHATKGTK